MRPFVLLTTIVLLAFAGSPARADDPKPPEKPPEKPGDKAAERGYLGFTPVAVPLLTGDLRAGLRITALFGVVVTDVVENAPAAKAGLKPGDFLLKIAGKDVPDTTSLDPTDGTAQRRFADAFQKLAEDIKPGVEVELLIRREGDEKTLKAKTIDKATLEQIQKDNKEGKPKEGEDEAKNLGYLGFEARLVSGLSYKQKKRWKVKAEKGIVAVRVLKDSPAQKAGLANGDVLLKYAGVAVPTAKEIEEAKDPREFVELAFDKLDAAIKAGAEVEIVVEREGQPVTLKATAVDKETINKIDEASGEDDG